MTHGVVFGTFDHFHPGHQWFLLRSAQYCDHLFVSVAGDDDVMRRKHHAPRYPVAQRITQIQTFLPMATVIEGDTQDGEWSVFKHHRIDCCIIGYDQQRLAHALQQWSEAEQYPCTFYFLGSYFPQYYKSSLYV